ncbi:MAG: dual specificity protein phosphatase family protein [Candidatus Liptonbacteria bacterium]|nr:dual specificity protein phosphatase family protein [Candidatus Liptonbacteria bacterium]
MSETTHAHITGNPLDYHHIADGIFVGTNQCCLMGLHEVLKNEGITADISLEENRLDQPFGVAAYLWLPTPDHAPPSKLQLALGIAMLLELISHKQKVYVHCKNGHGRAPTLVAAFLIAERGYAPEKAIALLKSKRSSVHLQPGQEEMLKRLAA